MPFKMLDEIPRVLLDELSATYAVIDMSRYGDPITDECKSRNFKHRDVRYTTETHTLIDPITFEAKVVENVAFFTAYMCRGIFTEDSAIIYDIMSVADIPVDPANQAYF